MLRNKNVHLLLNRVISILVISSLSLGLLFYVTPAQSARAANLQPVQTFYLPMPEDMVLASYKKIASSSAAPMVSVTGISITSNNTVIYYDQWENGYDLDLANPLAVYSSPANLGGTQIWGNGKAADGCPPNIDGKNNLTCSDANDVLMAGNTIVLNNPVTLPRVTTNIFYDGRDKLGVTKVVAVTRSVWANTPGTVLADAIEGYDTTRWGTSYIVPIGQNTSASSMFSYTSMMVMASQNNTTVGIDADANGTAEISRILNQGDTYQVDGGVLAGATVTADKPVQVDLLTGKLASTYASRWFQVPPTSQVTDSLWTAVGTTTTSYPANVFLFNPGAAAISVSYETQLSSGSVTVNAKSNYRFEMPLKSGAHFYTANHAPFMAVGTMDSSATGANQTYDWGYTLVPDTWLTTAFVAGWAPGTSTYSGNGSPIWVTAVKPTTVYVIYGTPNSTGLGGTDPNGKPVDQIISLNAFESRQIFGTNNTQTGMKVYTVDGTSITGAWGEDPSKASAGTPYIDAGYTIPPLPEVVLNKQSGLAVDVNGNKLVDPGDTLVYTVTVRNNGAVVSFNTIVSDTVPLNTTYVANSSKLNSSAFPDNTSPATAYPLDEGGYNVGSLAVGGSAVFTYRMLTSSTPNYTTIQNTAYSEINGEILKIVLNTKVNNGATTCTLSAVDSSGSAVSYYLEGTRIYLRILDNDSKSKGPLAVTLIDTTSSDRETVSLTENGLNTGDFRGSIASSNSSGQAPGDSTLFARSGDTLAASYTDPLFGDSCSASSTIAATTQYKFLYFSGPGSNLDRVDPVNTNKTTTYVSNLRLSTSSGSSGTFSVSTTAGRDNYMRSNSATTNYGSTSSVSINNRSSRKNRAIFWFDLSALSIPAGATINWARFILYQTSSTGSYSMYVHRLTNNWTEGTANGATGVSNWNQRLTGTNWTTAGGDYDATQDATLTVGTTNNSNYTWDITSLYNEWLAGTANYGLLLKAATETAGSSSTHTFNSREATSNKPTLTVNYTVSSTSVNNLAFSQTTPMATDLTLVKDGVVKVTSYISVTAGTLPASPAITAQLEVDGAAIVSLTNPPVVTGTSPVYKLEWTTTLGAQQKVLAGKSIVTRITTNQANLTFAVLYGSKTRPSSVQLPTNTYIRVDSLAVYDAASPDGVVLPNPVNGQTVYIRPSISDPFGYTDIISASLAIRSPLNVVSTVTLNDTNRIDFTTSSKTYEYAWLVPAATGTYTITLTGYEGYEHTVMDSRSLTVDVVNTDTGTPAKIEFTTGSNGVQTTNYATNGLVCVRVTDFDQNTNSLTTQAFNVTVNAPSDSKTFSLTETGPDTGIFAGCYQSSTTTSTNRLLAPAGSLLTATYIDPADATDKVSTNAIIPAGTSTLSVSKNLVTSSIAAVGDTIRYNLNIANPNNFPIYEISITDSFASACMTYDSASLAPDSTTANSLVWNDIGNGSSIEAYGSRTVIVYFKAAAACTSAAAANSISVSATDGTNAIGPVNASNNLVTTTRPQLSVTKSLTSTPLTPAQMGDTVRFTIQISNTGTTTINNLPLADTYSGYCLTFSSASNGGSGSGGLIQWANLGPLAPAGSVSVTVDFVVAGPCSPAEDFASVANVVDTNGSPVPDAQSSASIVTTVSAPQFSLKKVLQSSSPVQYGSPLTYTVFITNTGFSALTRVVLTDTHSTCLSFVSADLAAPTSTIAGQEVWNTLVPALPPIYAGQAISITMRMQASYAGPTPCENTISAYVIDQYDQALGPQTSSAGVQINSGLTGLVFKDLNGDGVQQVSEVGLSGVTVKVYNSTGGLIATTTSGVGGGYTFGSLPTGSYNIVETDPPLYFSTTNNAVPVNIPPTAFATVNFGDQPQGTISGIVFNDINGDGVQQTGENGLSGVTITLYNSGGQVDQATSQADGSYNFSGVTAGSYTVQETDLTGDVSTTSNTVPVLVAPGGAGTANFGDQQKATISGVVFNDLNGDGLQQPSEAGISGVSVSLNDLSGELSNTTTDGSGHYVFVSVSAGNYTVVETDPTGYTSTTENAIPALVVSGGAATANFGDQEKGTLSGFVYDDLNGDGQRQGGEPGIGGVTIVLKDSGGSTVGTTLTLNNGSYLFSSILTGSYSVIETDPDGYISITTNNVSITVPASGAATANFGDLQKGTISGVVYNDLNGDGVQQASEPGIGGVTVELKDSGGTVIATITTAGDGSYLFRNIAAGEYTMVETAPADYTSTFPADKQQPITLPSGGAASANFGNQAQGTISGVVFQDLNGNGLQDSGENGLGGVKVILSDTLGGSTTAITAGDGSYLWTGIVSGSYTVKETTPSPYSRTTANSVAVNVASGGAGSANFGNALLDFGDLPAGDAATTLAENGARHLVSNHLYLGLAAPGPKQDGTPSATASFDLSDDGVTLQNGSGVASGWSNGTVASSSGGALQITIGSDNNTSGYPQVFVDFGNGSGGLSNTLTEVVLRNSAGTALSLPLAPGVYTVYFDIPDGAISASTQPFAVRTRLSSAGGLTAKGLAADGEVEDYLFSFTPTAVLQVSFLAQNPGISAAVLVLLVSLGALLSYLLRFRREPNANSG